MKCLYISIGLVLFSAGASAQSVEPPKHLSAAILLLKNVKADDTKYVHGEPAVQWQGRQGAEKYICQTDCSGLIDALLASSYGYGKEEFKRWLGKNRPTADSYHDAIVEQNGFTHVPHLKDAKPGDLLAVKYAVKKVNTGHIMLVAGLPKKIEPKKPLTEGMDQWEVTIIDSSMSGHGPTDTRHKSGEGGKDHTGLGQGILRVYTKNNGEIGGWTWSSTASSAFKDIKEEHLVLGRLKSDFKP